MILDNSELTGKISAAAIEVHRELGPGFLEKLYEEALAIVLGAQGISYQRQQAVPVFFRNTKIGEHCLDMLVGGSVIVELKATAAVDGVHFATLRSYLNAAKLETALLFNFATIPLTIKRVGRRWTGSTREPASLY